MTPLPYDPKMNIQMREINFPKIVCLSGSSRFKEEFDYAAQIFTYHGWIVLSMCFFSHHEKTKHNDDCERFDRIKPQLDELHKRKIDLADLVFIIDVGGYIGESTRSELLYAQKKSKPYAFWRTSEVNFNKLVLK